MAHASQNYYKAIRDALDASLNLRFLPSEEVERQSRPEVEFAAPDSKLLMRPLTICRTEQECTLVEASVNSVRVSFTTKKAEGLDELLSHTVQAFFALRADKFKIYRKKPVEGYDFSFLITDAHLEKYSKEALINFVLEFIQGIAQEIKDLVLSINSSSAAAAKCYAHRLAGGAEEGAK